MHHNTCISIVVWGRNPTAKPHSETFHNASTNLPQDPPSVQNVEDVDDVEGVSNNFILKRVFCPRQKH